MKKRMMSVLLTLCMLVSIISRCADCRIGSNKRYVR